MRKKGYISISLLLTFLLSVFGACFVAADSMPPVLFDLDLSAYNAETKTGLADKTGNMAGFTVKGTPTVDTLYSAMGETAYATFATGTDSVEGNNNDAVFVVDAPSIMGKDALTVEIWAYIPAAEDRNDDPRLFAINDGEGAATSMELLAKGNYFTFRPNGDTASQLNFGGLAAEWKQYLVTRKWNEAGGGWDYQCFANGARRSVALKTCTRASDEGLKLCIGGNGEAAHGLQGSIALFRVYDGEVTEAQAASMYNAEKLKFVPLPESMELLSISPNPENGDLLASSPDEITLTFDNFIDEDSITDSIRVTDASGNEPKEEFLPYLPEAKSKVLKIRHGALETDSTYNLEITDLKSVNNISYSGSFSFITNSSREVVFEEDFEGDEFVVDKLLSDPENVAALESLKAKGFSASYGTTLDDWSHITVRKASNGDKYLEITGNTVSEQTSLRVDFAPISAGKTILELVMRPETVGAPRYSMGTIATDTDPDATKVVLARTNAAGTAVKGWLTKAAWAPGQDFYYDSLLAADRADGFHTLVFGIEPYAESGYLMYTRETCPEGSSNGASHPNQRWHYGSGETSFHGVEFGKITAYGQNVNEADKLMLSSISLRRELKVGILDTNADYLAPDDTCINVTFDSDVLFAPEATLATVTNLTDGNAKEIEFAYNADLRTAELYLTDYFDYGTEYQVTFPKAEDAAEDSEPISFSFKTPEYPLTVTEQNVAERKLTLKNSKRANLTGKILFVAYEADGRINSVTTTPFTVGGNKTSVVSFGGAVPTGGTAAVYVWDTTDGLNRPILSDAIEVPLG